MKKLKIVFHALYFAYLLVSVLMFMFKQKLLDQAPDLTFLLRFLNFWIVLGFFFFVAIWVIQMVHIRFLKKDMEELEDELFKVKSKLYDADRGSTNVNIPPKSTAPTATSPLEGLEPI